MSYLCNASLIIDLWSLPGYVAIHSECCRTEMFGSCRLSRVRCLDPSVSLRILLRVDDPDRMGDPALRTWIAQLQSQLLHHVYIRFNEVRWQVLKQETVLAHVCAPLYYCQEQALIADLAGKPPPRCQLEVSTPVRHRQHLPVAHACRPTLVRQPPATSC